MNLLEVFIGATIAVVVFANVFMKTITSTNTTGWDAGTTALFGILGLLGIVVIIRGLGVF